MHILCEFKDKVFVVPSNFSQSVCYTFVRSCPKPSLIDVLQVQRIHNKVSSREFCGVGQCPDHTPGQFTTDFTKFVELS